MTLDYATRRDLERIAADLRTLARAAKDNAANHDLDGGTDDAEHWAGTAKGHMEAHGLIAALLVADRDPISVGDEVVFLYFDGVEGLPLTNIDAHYDVLEIRNGMAGLARATYRGRPCAAYVNHWAPLTAIKRTSDGHRCPDPAAHAKQEAGAR